MISNFKMFQKKIMKWNSSSDRNEHPIILKQHQFRSSSLQAFPAPPSSPPPPINTTHQLSRALSANSIGGFWGVSRDARLPGHFCHFYAIVVGRGGWSNNRWCLPLGFPVWEILDPPLHDSVRSWYIDSPFCYWLFFNLQFRSLISLCLEQTTGFMPLTFISKCYWHKQG